MLIALPSDLPEERQAAAAAIIVQAKQASAKLFGLLPATQKVVALPIPSYSLKVVEQYVGY